MASNWVVDTNVWLPIETLATSYKGPVVLADETKTIQWFCAKQDRAAVEHPEHARDGKGRFEFDGVLEDGETQKPKMVSRKVQPAFWAMARIID